MTISRISGLLRWQLHTLCRYDSQLHSITKPSLLGCSTILNANRIGPHQKRQTHYSVDAWPWSQQRWHLLSGVILWCNHTDVLASSRCPGAQQLTVSIRNRSGSVSPVWQYGAACKGMQPEATDMAVLWRELGDAIDIYATFCHSLQHPHPITDDRWLDFKLYLKVQLKYTSICRIEGIVCQFDYIRTAWINADWAGALWLPQADWQ